MKLSIIIPIYNVEKYIEKCLLSCVIQDVSYNNYEIIVVNDGSQDSSLPIAERIAKEYSNITIFNQENQGLSAARNAGLKHANGEYIWFVDSDDYIEKNCLSRIFSFLKDDLDILQLQYRHVYEDDTPPQDVNFCNIKGIKTGLEVTEQGGLPAPAQFSVLRSKFLKENELEFVRGIYHEDTEFKPRVTYLAKKITSDTEVSYNYLQRLSGSITSSFKLKNAMDLIKVNNSLLAFAKVQNMPSRYQKHLYRRISLNINSLLMGFRQLSIDDKIVVKKQLKVNRHFFTCMVHSGIIKYQVEGLLFNFNLSLGLSLHNYIR